MFYFVSQSEDCMNAVMFMLGPGYHSTKLMHAQACQMNNLLRKEKRQEKKNTTIKIEWRK